MKYDRHHYRDVVKISDNAPIRDRPLSSVVIFERCRRAEMTL